MYSQKVLWASLLMVVLVVGAGSLVRSAATPVTLHRLGYPDDMYLQGSDPSFVFYVPLSAGIDVDRSFVELHLTVSPVIDDQSSLKVLINDRPLRTTLVRDISRKGKDITIKVWFHGVKIKSFPPALKVEVRGHLFITRNICQDLATGNLWFVIRNDSFVSLTSEREEHPLTVATFLDGFFEQVHLILPKGLSRESSTVYTKLFTFLQRHFRDRGVLLKVFPFDQAPVSQDNLQIRIIYIEGGGDQLFLDSEGQLHISSGGIDAFLSSWRRLLVVRSATIGMVEEQVLPTNKVTLEKLGYEPVVLRGVGDLTASYHFTVSDLGGIPRRVRLILYGQYTPIHTDSEAQGYLKVHLNGLLVKALPLPANGTINGLSVNIPSYVLKRENTLNVTYAYYPETGKCVRGTAPFEGWVEPRSYLEIAGYRKDEHPGFANLPGSFLGRGLIILPNEKNPTYYDYLRAATYLLASFRQLDRVPIVIEIADAEEAAEKTADYYLFAVPLAEMSEFQPIVKMKDEEMSFYNPLTDREVFRVGLSDRLGVLQVFSYQKQPAVSIGLYGTDTRPMLQLGYKLLNVDTLRRLQGNVAFFKDGNLVSLDVGKRLRVKILEEKNIWYYYQRYQILIFLVLLVLLAVAAWLVYRRLARVKESGKQQ